MGVLGAPDFVERHVISTWGACSLVLRWVPRGPERGVSDPTGSGILVKPHPGTGGGRQRGARVRARGKCGPSFAEGVPLGTGAVDALRWTLTVASNSLARKSVPTLHMHTPA